MAPEQSGAAREGSILLCDKPAGITSHDMVVRVRRERSCKVGHAGTLDPFATGLLLMLLGRATRLQRFLVALPKTYLATARATHRLYFACRERREVVVQYEFYIVGCCG